MAGSIPGLLFVAAAWWLRTRAGEGGEKHHDLRSSPGSRRKGAHVFGGAAQATE